MISHRGLCFQTTQRLMRILVPKPHRGTVPVCLKNRSSFFLVVFYLMFYHLKSFFVLLHLLCMSSNPSTFQIWHRSLYFTRIAMSLVVTGVIPGIHMRHLILKFQFKLEIAPFSIIRNNSFIFYCSQ